MSRQSLQQLVDETKAMDDGAEDDEAAEDEFEDGENHSQSSYPASLPDMVSSDGEFSDDEEERARLPKSKTKSDFSDFGAEDLSAKLKEMTKEMDAIMQQQRRISGSRQVLRDPLSPPRKSRKLALKENFDPPRKHATVVPDSEGAGEDDNDLSEPESSQPTPRRKFQQEWRIIGTKSLEDHSPEDIQKWLTDVADAEMRKSGEHSIFRRKPGDLGDFRRSHVRAIRFLTSNVTHLILSHFLGILLARQNL